jgi:prepilin-type N-terminal cleavage/methylation domain-containing protein
MIGRLRNVRSEESGFTLVELLTAMTIGTVLLMAAFTLLDRASAANQEVANRQDALQRGRQGMELVVRQLRSQVCLGDETEPITVADDNAVTFYADLSDGSQDVRQHTIRYDTATKTLFQDTYIGTGDYPDLVFSDPPSSTAELVSGVEPILDSGEPRPILRFYAFREGGQPGDLELLPTPLSSDDAIRTVMVKVGFVVLPDNKRPEDREATTLESDIYVRLADPSRPAEGPRCI